VYHLAAAGSPTWFDFARAIFDLAAVHPLPTLVPISTAEYAARAARPAYSVLDCSKTAQCFDVRIPDWQTVLRDVMTSQKSTDAH